MKEYQENGTPTPQFIAFMQAKYKAYMRSTATSLHDVYSKPSKEKLDALNIIRGYADTAVHIISYNSHHFTVAYFIYDESLDTNLFVVKTKNICIL